MSLSSLLPGAKRNNNNNNGNQQPEIDLSAPQHTQSILWGQASRNTLANDESTTQWIDGSVSRQVFINTPNSKTASYGKGKTPRSTYHERVEQSFSRPVLTPSGSSRKKKKKKKTTNNNNKKNNNMMMMMASSPSSNVISNSKTPKSKLKITTKSSSKKKKTKKLTTSSKKKGKRSKSPQKHNFNNLKHISKGAYTDSASNLRWASELRTHEVLPSPTRHNNLLTSYRSSNDNDRIIQNNEIRIDQSTLDTEVTELTKKLDAVSGKQNLFNRLRQLEKTNMNLAKQNSVISSQMNTMKNLLTEERSKVTLLQIEIDRVTVAANELRNVMSAPPSQDINNNKNNTFNSPTAAEKGALKNADAMTKSLGDWVVEGVCDVFTKFDKDNDGVLNAREMNTLQVALGNNERYTEATLLGLCMANGVDNHNGGITLNGLMTLYNTLGSEATAKDLAKLGIRVGPLLYPRRALEHAAERLVEARKKLQNAKLDSDTLTQSLNQERIMSNELKNECERYRKQYDEGMTQVEMMNINLSKAMSELENERSGRAYAENKVIRLEKELQNVKEACKDMHNLLKLKINEKETFQRALWSVEQKAEQMRNISIKTKGKMFEEKRKQQELMKANMVLHQKTIDERKRLKEKQEELKQLKKKPTYSAFGYTTVMNKADNRRSFR